MNRRTVLTFYFSTIYDGKSKSQKRRLLEKQILIRFLMIVVRKLEMLRAAHTGRPVLSFCPPRHLFSPFTVLQVPEKSNEVLLDKRRRATLPCTATLIHLVLL